MIFLGDRKLSLFFMGKNMEDKIVEFIRRRFPKDQDWTTGNCYFFALILNDVFEGDIVYDVIVGHFMFQSREGELYDWTGRVAEWNHIVKWKDFDTYDAEQKTRIIRDCIR